MVNLTLSSGTLTGPTTATTDATGQASFSNLSIMPPGTGYTLTASATGLPSVRSNAFNILALRGTSLTFTTQPSDTTAGSNLGPVTLAVPRRQQQSCVRHPGHDQHFRPRAGSWARSRP